ncbi:MAG TPA: hypothetical protein PKZ76_01515 [Xanthomonadaceae bacterium]|nr:hypothetical protein [Xanthomonadaceae bacterium]
MPMRILALAASLLLLGGCTSDSGDCPGGDYAELGRKEAGLGMAATLPSATCTPGERSLADYLEGRREGLLVYCRGPQGWNDGLVGDAEPDLCPEDDFPDYVQAERLAREHRKFEREAEVLRREIDALPEEETGVQRRQLHRLIGEMEAIRGVATIREWVGPQGRGDH